MKSFQQHQRDDSGVTAVEFALLMPLFLLLVLAIIEFGTLYFNYSRIERGVFLAQKDLSEGRKFTSAIDLKTRVCEEAQVRCNIDGFILSLAPLTAKPSPQPQVDAFKLTPGQPHLLQVVYPWSGVFPEGALSYIGLSNLEKSNMQVGVFFHVKK